MSELLTIEAIEDLLTKAREAGFSFPIGKAPRVVEEDGLVHVWTHDDRLVLVTTSEQRRKMQYLPDPEIVKRLNLRLARTFWKEGQHRGFYHR